MMSRSDGFYHDDDPPGLQSLGTAALAIFLVIVSAETAGIVLLARAFLLTAGQ